jgi:glycosyltransferase involved in cell wall biosynthesis
MLPRRAQDAHVVMLAQYLPLHFVSTMRHLAGQVGKLSLLLSQPMDASRDWAPEYADLDVHLQRSWEIGIKHSHPLGFEERGTLIIPHSTRADLKRLDPDAVISVEVGARTMQAAALQALGMRYKLIVQVRESENTAQSRGRVRRRLRSFLLPRADGVFANGQSGRRHVLDCGVPDERISIVPSGTDTELFGTGSASRAMSVESDPQRPLRLLYVGQLNPRKGLMPLAHGLLAVATDPHCPVEWTLAGRGPMEAELRAMPWPPHITLQFLGSRPYRELPQVYAAADVFVMPSLSDEWGMVVNEAMASGLPVLGCTGAQAVEELVVDGFSGWTFAPEDHAAIRHGLARILQATPADLRRMGSRARQKALAVSDRHTAQAMATGVTKAMSAP